MRCGLDVTRLIGFLCDLYQVIAEHEWADFVDLSAMHAVCGLWMGNLLGHFGLARVFPKGQASPAPASNETTQCLPYR